MSMEAVRKVYDSFKDPSSTSASEQAVLLALAWCQNKDDKRCYPSVDTLQAMTHFKRSTIHNALNTLEEKSLIVRNSGGRTKGGKSFANSYILNLDATSIQMLDDQCPNAGRPVSKCWTTSVQTLDDQCPNAGHQPKYNHNIIQNPTQRKKPDWMDGLEDGDECFEAFWKSYPEKFFSPIETAVCKTPKQKSKALAEYRKMLSSIDDEESIQALKAEILTGIRKWTSSNKWKYDDPKYIPQPANWIMNVKWRDDPPEFTPPPAVMEALHRQQMQERLKERAKHPFHWRLCYERCAHYDRSARKCLKGREIPTTLWNPPDAPEKCPSFTPAPAKKEYPGPYPDWHSRYLI